MDDEVRKAAVGAIKEKAAALAEERAEIRAGMADLDRRLRRNEVALLDCRSAARLFDTDIELPEELATARGVWVRRIMNDAPSPPWATKSPPPSPPSPPQPPTPSPSLASLSPFPEPRPPWLIPHDPPKSLLGGLLDEYTAGEPTVREIALEQLKRAGSAGTRAANIRQVVESILKKTVHDKTVGMTLYRLSKEGKVRRDGQTWFIAPEVMNPGAGAPGPEDRSR